MSESFDVGPARALLALGLGGFSIGTGEFVIMGLLPEVARDVGVTIPVAGHLISAYALGVVIGAPVLAVLTARWPRRRLLIALMTLYAIGNLATTLVPGDLLIGLMRFASGFPHGTYFGVAALVAAGLVPPNQRARAVSFVLLGLTAAMVAGVPLATWLGQHLGWRAAFVFVAAAALVAAIMIRVSVPEQPSDENASPMRELSALARPQVWLTLAVAGVGFGGLFCVYSYIKPTLIEVSGMNPAHVPLALLLFGVGGVAGLLIGARFADRALIKTNAGTLLYSAILLAAFGTLAHQIPTAMMGVFLLGTFMALGPAIQIRLMDVAGDAQTLAAALNHSAFNFANALGAWLGGVVIAAGWPGPPLVGSAPPCRLADWPSSPYPSRVQTRNQWRVSADPTLPVFGTPQVAASMLRCSRMNSCAAHNRGNQGEYVRWDLLQTMRCEQYAAGPQIALAPPARAQAKAVRVPIVSTPLAGAPR